MARARLRDPVLAHMIEKKVPAEVAIRLLTDKHAKANSSIPRKHIEQEMERRVTDFYRLNWRPWMKVSGEEVTELPHVVLKSRIFRKLNYPAKWLYVCLASQLNSDGSNNGNLDATLPYLQREFGWRRSPQALAKALGELKAVALVEPTRGQRGWAKYKINGVPD